MTDIERVMYLNTKKENISKLNKMLKDVSVGQSLIIRLIIEDIARFAHKIGVEDGIFISKENQVVK